MVKMLDYSLLHTLPDCAAKLYVSGAQKPIDSNRQHDLTPRIYVLQKIAIALKIHVLYKFKFSGRSSLQECHADNIVH